MSPDADAGTGDRAGPMLAVPLSTEARFYGKFRAVVSDNDDPKAMGRLRAKVPEVLGDIVAGWALPCTPYAGDGMGLWNIPPVGSGVWIEFEAGDPSRPIWTGCWWGEGQAPADAVAQKIWKTDSGHLIRLDDDAGTIEVEESGGGKITLDGGGIILESNGCKIEITSSGITLDGGGGKVEVTSSSVSVNSGALEVT